MNIGEYIKETDWKFSDLLQLEKTSKTVATKIFDDASHVDMLNLVWDETVSSLDEPLSFGSFYMQLCLDILTKQVMEAFQEYFESAIVTFAPPTLIEEQSYDMIKETPPPPKPKKEKPKKSVKGDDGLDMKEGVERL